MKSKDVELCELLATALVALQKARKASGYAVVAKRLHANTLDLDSLIENLKAIASVACNTVVDRHEQPIYVQLAGRAKRTLTTTTKVEDAEKSEESTGDQEYWESVVAANLSIGKLAWLSPEEVRKNREVEQLLSIATPILVSLIQSDATTCASDDLVPPSDLADLTMAYVTSLIAAVRKDVDSRTLCNGN